MLRKKGALTQQVLISLIILIIAAAILFFVLKIIPYKPVAEKEACHQSVILRSKSIMGTSPSQYLVPLNCKTQYIKISTTNENVIKKEIANAMYDCWWMLGEGKLDFFSESFWRQVGIPGLGTAKSACVICSVIKFDNNLKEKPINLNILEYMEKTKIPEKNFTYLEYFTGQENAKLPTELKAETITTDKDYAVIFMGIRGGSFGEALRNIIGGAAIGGLIGFRLGSLKGAGIGAAILGGLQVILQPITQLTSSHAAAIHCEGETAGCMSLMLIPFEASSISEACQNIESIP